MPFWDFGKGLPLFCGERFGLYFYFGKGERFMDRRWRWLCVLIIGGLILGLMGGCASGGGEVPEGKAAEVGVGNNISGIGEEDANMAGAKEKLAQRGENGIGQKEVAERGEGKETGEGGKETEEGGKETGEGSQNGVVGEDIEEENGNAEEGLQEKEGAIKEILECADQGWFQGYQVDEDFLGWVLEEYGEKPVRKLQKAARKKRQDAEAWYKATGESIHALWGIYCQDRGILQEGAEKTYVKECASQGRVILDFTGDINLAEGGSVTSFLDRQEEGVQGCFSEALLEEMRGADILVVNNEFTYSGRGEPLPGKAFTFRAKPERVGVLGELGADVASLANNHVYDFGEEALLDTFATLEGAQIPYVGAGRNLEEAMKPVYFLAGGRKIAIVAATQIERSANYTKEATENSAGVLKTLDPGRFVSVIEKARGQSDYVIVFVHWGTEHTNYYGKDQEELGKAFIDAGADVVIGGHTHCLQGFGYYNGKPVIYSLGNFWFNGQAIDTGLFQVVLHTKSNEAEFRFLPCIQKGCAVSLVEEAGERQRILGFMQNISAPEVSVNEEGCVSLLFMAQECAEMRIP